MKKFIYPVICVLILFAISCESPTNDDNDDLAETIGSKFNRELLQDEGDFSVGYANGNIRSSKITLTWSETDERNFSLYQLTRDGEELVLLQDISEISFTDSLLSENHEYFYQLNVVTDDEICVQDTISIKTARWSPPSNLQVHALSQYAVKLTWDDNSDTEDYFRVHPSTEGEFLPSQLFEANTNQAIITDLSLSREYSFRITSESPYEDGIISSTSVNYTIWQYNLNLSEPGFVHGNVNPDKSIKLHWLDNSGCETGFIVERKINQGDFIEIANVAEIDVVEFVDSDTLAYQYGDILKYRLRTYNDFVEVTEYSDYSNECEIEATEFSQDAIYLYLTAWNTGYISWNIRKEGSHETIFADFQTFDGPGEMFQYRVDLEAGLYYLHCIDTIGMGSMAGSIYQGSNLLTSWEGASFTTNGHFNFEVSDN